MAAVTAAASSRFGPAHLLPRSRRKGRAPAPTACGAVGRGRRLRCEFVAGGGNGALSGEDDPRLIDRQKALDAAMNDINSSFGKGSVTRLGSAGGAFVETFPSGCLTLDFALGGGLPKGRVVEVYGPESSGKTTLALHAIAEVQKLGGNAMLVDAEHAFDPAYSKALGIDIENLIVCQPDNGEMALESKASFGKARNGLYSGRNEVARFQILSGPEASFVSTGPDWKRARFDLLPPIPVPDRPSGSNLDARRRRAAGDARRWRCWRCEETARRRTDVDGDGDDFPSDVGALRRLLAGNASRLFLVPFSPRR
uniref:RecA family profile 1 domain-containing protein n=1 Tax=Oryza meridionalis TaxID=40149 RepID=A0A0E0D409_9ORYZ